MIAEEVVLNEEKKRFEINTEGHLSILTYEMDEERLALIHTFVPEELEGKGIAGMLAHAAMEYARSHSLRVVPYCPYVQVYLKRHPEYQDLVEKPEE